MGPFDGRSDGLTARRPRHVNRRAGLGQRLRRFDAAGGGNGRTRPASGEKLKSKYIAALELSMPGYRAYEVYL